MSGLVWGLLLVVVATLVIAGAGRAVQVYLRRLRDDHALRPTLWNRFYTLDWGETATNNYGFAPSDEDKAPDRFQRQMYREMLKALRASGKEFAPGARLLEVSCGRGGGLDAFLEAAGPGAFEATGLDVAASAVSYCQKQWTRRDGVTFVEGSAMDLPFPDASIDVLLNVEASNDYPDRQRFFAEVRRVLKADGVFLYADTEKRKNDGRIARELTEAGFAFELRDITGNVVQACREDTPRRRAVIARAPLPARLLLKDELGNYAAIEGSTKFKRFASGERRYYLTAARPA
ncbi:class I SAM-dependent methyltransferase [Sphingomonas sp. LHG3406-1]|uniref:class I SAM-dependent methyltransferase n=1 Tax=Sphingomonas sp. LHG3406-1 TaxID=2804617 RepID=UPI00260A9E62|nr:class I SAM-dependent methyltransferase [Sphingomonas sp. LHG3406-1]